MRLQLQKRRPLLIRHSAPRAGIQGCGGRQPCRRSAEAGAKSKGRAGPGGLSPLPPHHLSKSAIPPPEPESRAGGAAHPEPSRRVERGRGACPFSPHVTLANPSFRPPSRNPGLWGPLTLSQIRRGRSQVEGSSGAGGPVPSPSMRHLHNRNSRP